MDLFNSLFKKCFNCQKNQCIYYNNYYFHKLYKNQSFKKKFTAMKQDKFSEKFNIPVLPWEKTSRIIYPGKECFNKTLSMNKFRTK